MKKLITIQNTMAKQEIARLHNQAMSYISQLGVEPEKAALLENYAKKLIGRAK